MNTATTTSYGKTVECEPSVAEISKGVGGTGEGPVSITAEVPVGAGGLSPGTTYHFRLVAGSEHGTNESQDETFTTLGPKFEQQSVSDVASTSATFDASVDPNGFSTSVYFEYGPCPSLSACASSGYPSSTVAEAKPIGAGKTPVPIEQHVQDLSAGTVYHYRVVGASAIEAGKVEAFDGSENTFSTQTAGTFSLIDGRGWEMVSPPAKEGALVIWPGEPGMFQAAAGGGAFTYLTNVPTEPGCSLGIPTSSRCLSTRGANGWANSDLAAPHNGSVGQSDNAGQEYRFFNEELTTGIVQPFGAFLPCEQSQTPAAVSLRRCL